jgi:hypothetical protein
MHTLEGAVNAGYAHMGVGLKGGVHEVVRYTTQESGAIVKGIRPGENSIRWHVKEGPTRKNHHRGLSEPVCVWASIQKTNDVPVKARFQLTCNFKADGPFRFRGWKKHELPCKGSGPVEVLFVGIARSTAPELPALVFEGHGNEPKSLGCKFGIGDFVDSGTDGPELAESLGRQANPLQRLHATIYCCAFVALSTFMYFTHFPLVLLLSRALILVLILKFVVH